jgi:hypothetical protein
MTKSTPQLPQHVVDQIDNLIRKTARRLYQQSGPFTTDELVRAVRPHAAKLLLGYDKELAAEVLSLEPRQANGEA